MLIDTHLRDYARASTVQIAVGIGSSVSFVVGWEFLQVLYKLLVRCVKAIRRLPPAAQIALSGCRRDLRCASEEPSEIEERVGIP